MLDVAEARALITTSLSDSDLEQVIAREEAWLARRIGPLDGERVETFVARDGDEVLRLTRPTTTVTVEDDGVTLDSSSYALRGWSDLVPVDGSWTGDVLVTYTPDDEDEVKRALITAVRLTLFESAYASEAAGGYSTSTDVHAQRTVRFALWRGLLRPSQPGTTRLRSTIPFGGSSLAPVGVVASGS